MQPAIARAAVDRKKSMFEIAALPSEAQEEGRAVHAACEQGAIDGYQSILTARPSSSTEVRRGRPPSRRQNRHVRRRRNRSSDGTRAADARAPAQSFSPWGVGRRANFFGAVLPPIRPAPANSDGVHPAKPRRRTPEDASRIPRGVERRAGPGPARYPHRFRGAAGLGRRVGLESTQALRHSYSNEIGLTRYLNETRQLPPPLTVRASAPAHYKVWLNSRSPSDGWRGNAV